MPLIPQVKELRKGLLAWYNFKEGAGVLYIGKDEDACAELLSDISKRHNEEGKESLTVDICTCEESVNEVFVGKNKSSFDYIICANLSWVRLNDSSWGTLSDPVGVLSVWNSLLKEDGICFFGFNNRLGSGIFCGDQKKGRLYSKAEMENDLKKAGFVKSRAYSVLSALRNPSHIFAGDYLPKEDISNRLFPTYETPETVFMEEEALYKDFADNNIFHQTANSFLFETAKSEKAVFSDILQVTSSMERDPENAFLTILRGDGTVLKKNVFPEGAERFKHMCDYSEDLQNHGIDVVDMDTADEGLIMPLIDAPTGQLALKNALLTDKAKFLEMLDEFKDCIMRSSDIEKEDSELGPVARYGYIDMVPLNSFYFDGKFVFFDQEFRIDHYPLNAILARMIATFYFGNAKLNEIIPAEDLYRRYGLLENRKKYFDMEMEFLDPLRNEDALRDYHARIRRNKELTGRNRERMRFSADRYLSVFSQVFSGCDTKDVYVFGSGRFAHRFMDWYGPVLNVKGILDNDKSKWGEYLYGTEIFSPEMLKDKESFKVIICIKDYLPIISQLDKMGIDDYSVYDGRTVYPRKIRGFVHEEDGLESKKPYHIGYISGTFDLFHKGHLNLLRKAKEKCDYLIVGVVTDEGVRRFKHVEPFIPFEERMEIVASCKYVDEANPIPVEHRDIRSAYELYHFDCQFCGSDYLNDPVFMNDKLWLEERGSELEILPYTESTSSSKIKKMIEEKLL